MLGNGVGTQTPLGNLCGVHKYAEEAGWECVTTPSAARVLNPRSAFAPFDGILGRITEPLARAASEIEIPAVAGNLAQFPSGKCYERRGRFRDLRKNGCTALDRSGFSSVRLHGVPSRKGCPLSSSRIQGHPETAWFSFLKLPFPQNGSWRRGPWLGKVSQRTGAMGRGLGASDRSSCNH